MLQNNISYDFEIWYSNDIEFEFTQVFVKINSMIGYNLLLAKHSYLRNFTFKLNSYVETLYANDANHICSRFLVNNDLNSLFICLFGWRRSQNRLTNFLKWTTTYSLLNFKLCCFSFPFYLVWLKIQLFVTKK